MPQLFRPPRFPAPLEPSPPLDPASIPPPPPPPPVPVPIPPLAAAKHEERRPWPVPPLKKKKRPEFGRMERAFGMAMIGLHIVICIVMLLNFATAPHESRFWIWLCLYLCFSAIVVVTCVDICYDDPSPQQKAAAVLHLPPPPPEMDMC